MRSLFLFEDGERSRWGKGLYSTVRREIGVMSEESQTYNGCGWSGEVRPYVLCSHFDDTAGAVPLKLIVDS